MAKSRWEDVKEKLILIVGNYLPKLLNNLVF